MDELYKQLTSLFDQLRQPVLIIEGERLRHLNAAARAQLPLLPPQDYVALKEGVAAVGGRVWKVAEQQIAHYRVLTLEAADDADAVPTQMLDVVSQTLRGSLATAMSVSQTMFPRLEAMENPKTQMEMAAMNRSFYQMLRLAGNLSDLAQYLRGDRHLKRQPVEICKWFTCLGEKLEPYCRLRELRLEVQVPDKQCWVDIDSSEVERALLNLISNAMKFTPAGGRISIQLEIGRSQVRIKVLDDGEGMDPDVLETLYWRAVNRKLLGDPRWGVGLGMQLVRQIAIAHGGTVLAERREGGGTCVTLSLSRQRSAATIMRTPIMVDYSGGFNRVLMELSDALPLNAFDSKEVN